MAGIEKSLRGIRVFKDLTPAALDELNASIRWREFRAEHMIIGHQDRSTDVFFIVSGSVRVTIYSPDGKEITFRDLDAGEMFGEIAAIDGQPRSAAVVGLSAGIIALMSAQQFWQALQRHPTFAAATLKQLALTIRGLSNRVFEISAFSVRNRIHAEVLRMARAHPAGQNRAAIRPFPTHAEIASRISTHREGVSRELSKLTKSDLITRKQNTLYVNDIARLARLVNGPHGIDSLATTDKPKS